MMNANFGSDGFWRLIGILAVIGVLSAIYNGIKAIIWIYNHVHIN